MLSRIQLEILNKNGYTSVYPLGKKNLNKIVKCTYILKALGTRILNIMLFLLRNKPFKSYQTFSLIKKTAFN